MRESMRHRSMKLAFRFQSLIPFDISVFYDFRRISTSYRKWRDILGYHRAGSYNRAFSNP